MKVNIMDCIELSLSSSFFYSTVLPFFFGQPYHRAMIPLVSTDRAPRKSHESVETEVLDARSLPRLRFLSCQLRLPVTILVSVSRTLLHCRQIYLRASSFREIPRLSLRGYIPISVKRKPQGGRHGVSGWNVFKGPRVFNYF